MDPRKPGFDVVFKLQRRSARGKMVDAFLNRGWWFPQMILMAHTGGDKFGDNFSKLGPKIRRSG